jgi:hypothetical protein
VPVHTLHRYLGERYGGPGFGGACEDTLACREPYYTSVRYEYTLPHLEASKMAATSKRYSKKASDMVERAMRRRKRGTLRSSSGQKVTSRKQAIAIGLSEAREKGAKVPKQPARKK